MGETRLCAICGAELAPMTGKRGRPVKLCKACAAGRMSEYQREYYQRPESRQRRADRLEAKIKAKGAA